LVGGFKKELVSMPDSNTDLVEIQEITEEEGKKDQTLLADPSQGNEGILDDLDPANFVRREEEAAEGVILAEDVEEES
jgi:hypothetical protein